MALLLAVQAVFLVAVYAMARQYASPGAIIALDALALPGAEATIAVRVEHEPPLTAVRGIPGVEVEFRPEPAADAPPAAPAPAAGAPAAATGADGVAAVRVTAPATAGITRYRARVGGAGAPRLESAEAEVVLQVVPPGSAVVLVVASGSLRSALLDPEAGPVAGEAAALEPARTALRGLAGRGAIAYLGTRRGDTPARMHAQLAAEKLPPGAVFFAPGVKEWHEIRAALERQHLAAWKDRLWGICRTDEEALGLALAGFRAIIIGTIGIPGRAGNPPAGAGRILTARGWAEARRIIDKNL